MPLLSLLTIPVSFFFFFAGMIHKIFLYGIDCVGTSIYGVNSFAP